MKRILMAGAFALAAAGQVFAADLPEPMPPPPPRAPAMYVPAAVPIYNWGGLYFGINGGGAFGKSNWTTVGVPTTGSFTSDGFLLGGTLGANFQAGAFVFGVEADLDWTNFGGTVTNAGCLAFGGGVTSCETSSNYLGTARGRIGYAFDRLLIFATAGGAFANVRGTTNLGNTTTNEFGWTAGAGLEYALAPSWTAKAEYLFVDLQNGTCTVAACGGTAPVTISLYENVVRLGLNYKFSF